MRRWSLGLLVCGFFAGIAFILASITQNIVRVYRHVNGRPDYTVPMVAAAVVAAIAIAFWIRATRPE